jgi:hypothetical protein
MRERQGCRFGKHPGRYGTWVNDVSVDCAFGAWMVRKHGGCTSRARSASSLVTADDCLLAGRLGAPSQFENPTRYRGGSDNDHRS